MALACRPDLIIADEPTTALDVIVQAQILALLTGLVRERQISMIVISHDLSVLGETCDRLAVMYAGRMAEIGPSRQVLGAPRHPYTGHPVPRLPAHRRPRLTAGPGRAARRAARPAWRAHRLPVRAPVPRGDPRLPVPRGRAVGRRAGPRSRPASRFWTNTLPRRAVRRQARRRSPAHPGRPRSQDSSRAAAAAAPEHGPVLEARGLRVVFPGPAWPRPGPRGRRRQPGDRAGRDPRADRRVRLRQVHAGAGTGRTGAAEQRRGPLQRRRAAATRRRRSGSTAATSSSCSRTRRAH